MVLNAVIYNDIPENLRPELDKTKANLVLAEAGNEMNIWQSSNKGLEISDFHGVCMSLLSMTICCFVAT